MLPKKMRPKQVVAFRPIANIRLFYKVFACLVLDRIEHQLDDHRPEEQHGIRRGKRIEEHLLTANVFLDKALFFMVEMTRTVEKVIVMCDIFALTQTLVKTIHLQFVLPTVLLPPKPPLPHGLPLQNCLC